MSDGATMSAPARAWLTAVRASSSSVASLSTAPSSRSTPQWPWSVYSHRHTSVTTSSSGLRACLIARVASCTTPSSSHAPEPCVVLLGGDAEQHHRRRCPARRPPAPPRRRRRSTGARRRASSRSARVRPRRRRPRPRVDEQRQHQLAGAQVRLAHEPAQAGARAQPAHARLWKGHRPPRLERRRSARSAALRGYSARRRPARASAPNSDREPGEVRERAAERRARRR